MGSSSALNDYERNLQEKNPGLFLDFSQIVDNSNQTGQ